LWPSSIRGLANTKARLELRSEKLEKLYQLVKEETRKSLTLMIHYGSNVAKNDQELEKAVEDFRDFLRSRRRIPSGEIHV
jgi:hypothetical protein